MSKTEHLKELIYQKEFIGRHIGPQSAQTKAMLSALGLNTVEDLIEQTLPRGIRCETTQFLNNPKTEHEALAEIKAIAKKNIVHKSYIGMGYHDTHVPPVILRNVLENPGWYTAYTPYQPEIAQGRLEGLLNFQQMIIELTGMDLANASMLDEATAAAEAMATAKRLSRKNKSENFFIDADCHPQTISVIQTRAEHFGFNIIVDNPDAIADQDSLFGALIQYPGCSGKILDINKTIKDIHEKQALAVVSADIMSLALLKPPGEFGADIVVGSSQRFGVPMGFGGPHAAFFAFKEAYKRAAPGRIIGLSKDSRGKPALRMAMQTREQHIRREKANSNICTSQVLLALMSAFYAMYHGAEGVRRIAERIHLFTKILAGALKKCGFSIQHQHYFDTLCVDVGEHQNGIYQRALSEEINLRAIEQTGLLGISISECTTIEDIAQLVDVFSPNNQDIDIDQLVTDAQEHSVIPASLTRMENALQHEIFSRYQSETEMLRYLHKLEARDIALNHAMIPLGSCTMKLNSTSEMIPVTWPEFGKIHPFAPQEQTAGYRELFTGLETMLQICTGYDGISLQPNAGSQGEYAGLIVIKKYFENLGQYQRKICLIPASAHGTNPASAQMAGMKVVVTQCDDQGNVDVADLKRKVEDHGNTIAALMITYPSTHGVFEEDIQAICELIHSVGAQVYIDGANMNALVGLAAPGKFGGDVSHLNLHKTFCIPHGGGGPGMGPIGVKSHLTPFLPSHPIVQPNTPRENSSVSAAPWGSASILPISWMYINMMGNDGMKKATEYAILNANYIAHRLEKYFPILYRGKNGFVAHECLLDLRPIKDASGISEEDIAKRLMDFGFHAPTMSFPVAGTLMIEPTESESLNELNRFCEAMIKIRQEIDDVQKKRYPADNNPLVNAPHTMDDVLQDEWDRPYSRKEASQPLPYLKENKVWPTVNRIDNVYGDRNLICSCPSIENYLEN